MLLRNSAFNLEKIRPGQHRSKVVLHSESSPRTAPPLIEHSRATLLFGTQPFFGVFFFLFFWWGGGWGRVTG